jgi:hypothetical protein
MAAVLGPAAALYLGAVVLLGGREPSVLLDTLRRSDDE